MIYIIIFLYCYNIYLISTLLIGTYLVSYFMFFFIIQNKILSSIKFCCKISMNVDNAYKCIGKCIGMHVFKIVDGKMLWFSLIRTYNFYRNKKALQNNITCSV